MGVHKVLGGVHSCLQLTQPLEGAPERRVQLQGPMVEVLSLLTLGLLFTNLTQKVNARRPIWNLAQHGIHVLVMLLLLALLVQ